MRKSIIILILLFLLMNAGCSRAVPRVIVYDIVSTDFVSFDGIWRYTIKAHVDNVLTADELASASKSILVELADSKSVDALTVFFYLRDSDAGGTYTAGMAEWIPYGDWRRAIEVRSGDHSHNEWVMSPIGAPEVTPPELSTSLDETPTLVLDNNVSIKTGNNAATVFGTVTNKATYPIGDITLTFNLFDTVGNQIGVARAYLSEKKPIAPGTQWQFQATYAGVNGEKAVKAVRASLTFNTTVAPE